VHLHGLADETTASLSATLLCSAYKSLLFVLRHSQWDPISAALMSFQQSRGPRPITGFNWNSKPFPGFWACKRGVILWRLPSDTTIPSASERTLSPSGKTNLRGDPSTHQPILPPKVEIFPLFEDTELQFCTKVYWHLACGLAAFPTQPHLQSSKAAHLFSAECRRCHKAISAFLRFSREYEMLLIRLQALGSLRIKENNSSEPLAFTPPKMALQQLGKAKRMLQDDGERHSDTAPKLLNSPVSHNNQPLAVTSHGAKLETEAAFCNWMVFPVAKRTMDTVLRFLRLCEPLIAKGKTRVRWKCVSNKQDTKTCLDC